MGLLRWLFYPADRLYPKNWWCGSCKEMHYARAQPGWKVP